ncbi:NAD(P)-binding protein [Streptomyces sp. TRM 70351]|uniref:NAD(P)-binding protein n=1 Tax=Streptomyces sp. TRM 70351 TaxID=3116552 RepID=UPI002E7C02D6|nr:NAD(P)-binding protein [Streptomyces sp. TRM 70351]MEE1928883.1 NAD(P)-binding protein [Streptomyces sp. TRM 70351]
MAVRVGIAGGGVAGLTLAWLLDESHEVLLLEERPRLGGNAESVQTTAHGGTCVIDLGVRETPVEVSPIWRHIAASVGVPAEDLVPATASRVVFRKHERSPLWVSAAEPTDTVRPVTTGGPAYRAMVRFAEESAWWETEGMSWDVTIDDVLNAWSLPSSSVEHLLCALPASLHGCTLDEVRTLSARAVGAAFTPPDTVPRTTYLRSGATSLVQGLAAGSRSARLRTGTGLRAVYQAGEGFELVDAAGAVHPVDAVALALPADHALAALSGLAATGAWQAALSSIEYRDVTYVLHRDPYGMPEDRRVWSAGNTTVDEDRSETTTWYGPSLGVDLFVSQVGHRSGQPREEIARSSFRATLPTPAACRARQRLAEIEAGQRLLFLGHCTTPVETQEAAMASALAVAHHLAPRGSRPRRLRNYLEGG